MKRRYKLLLIIVIGAALTILINFITVKSLVNLVSIGDGFSLGMTPYNVAGPSFNDYLKDKLENKNKLDSYNNEFSKAHLTIHELNEYMEDNTLGKFTRNPIKQTIASADIITLSIGLDEFADLSLQNNLTTEKMENYISEVEKFLQTIREFYDKKIIIIGLYPAYKFDQSDAVEINNSLRFFRFIFILAAGFFGLYGITLGLLFFLIYTTNITSFNKPFFAPLAPFNK